MNEFSTLNLEEMQAEDTRLSNTGGEGNFLDQFVPMPQVTPGQTGSVVVRILPPVKGGKLYQYNRIHSVNGRKLHCPRPLVNGKWDRNVPCPLCDYYNALWRQADKLDDQGHRDEADKCKTEARSIKPIERYYYNAVVRKLVLDGVEKNNVGPRIFSIGKTLHKMIIRAIVGDDNEEALGDITNIKTGYDFVIKKELRGTGGNSYPNYDRSTFSRDPSPLGDKETIENVVGNMHDLTKFRNIKPYEEMEKELAIHRGLIADDSESFNINSFDSKFGSSEPSTSVSVSMTESAADSSQETDSTKDDMPPFDVTSDDAASDSTSDVSEDVSIDDDEFLKELQDMEG